MLTQVVDHIETLPDLLGSGSVGNVEFTSLRAMHLFYALNLLLELDPERAQKLAQAYPELALALKRYPKGCQPGLEELPAPDLTAHRHLARGEIVPDFEYSLMLQAATESKDFSKAFQLAERSYSADTHPKPRLGTKVHWPSARRYASLYCALGNSWGEAAEKDLARIKDEDLRFFAQIELAAGLVGLPLLTV